MPEIKDGLKGIYTKDKGTFLGWVNRSGNTADPDYTIDVELPCGYKERFWLQGLSDREYLRRARHLKKLSNA